MSKKTYKSVKDAFGNDVKVGDKLIFCDRIFGRLGKTHLRRIVNKSHVEVIGCRVDGTEITMTPCTETTIPFTWVVSTKHVMKYEW